MEFQEKLRNYAKVIVHHGLNIQEGQCLYVLSEPIHRDLLLVIVEEAYRAGARYVEIDYGNPRYTDPRFIKARVQYSDKEDLEFVPDYVEERAREMRDGDWNMLKIVGSEFPNELEDTDSSKVNTILKAASDKIEYLDNARMSGEVPWSIASGATTAWANEVFPDLDDEDALESLWEAIFEIAMADRENPIEAWEEHDEMLKNRQERLNNLGIDEIRFQDEGTDLTVGLAPQAQFSGGTWQTPEGIDFEPNIPSYEVFTAPDWRMTEGVVRATRPFPLNGKMVKGLTVWFEDGEVADFEAETGEDAFQELISTDEGSKRLGEVALVGIDSPIFQSGLIFHEILFDENAACHIAFGQAYTPCINGGDEMEESDFDEIGFNHETNTHHDIMISSENTTVTIITREGEEITIIENGKWTDF